MRALLGGVCLALSVNLSQAQEIPAIAYHDIVAQRGADPYAITVDEFTRQMDHLARNGYQPISLALLDSVREGRARLPEKPVLLTFDDGLKSYYEHAFPILRARNFPSLLGIVTAWIDRRSAPDGWPSESSDKSKEQLMTWDELRAVARSPLVEVLSHTDDLHGYVSANPWGSRGAAAVTRIYDPVAGYETDEIHRRRVQTDLARSVERLRAELGRAPSGVIWPYGLYDRALSDAARQLGLRYSFTLDNEPDSVSVGDEAVIERITFVNYRGLSDFDKALRHPRQRPIQLRFVEIDLARLDGQNEVARERQLSRLLDRLQLLQVNAVVLDPFTSDRRQAYFDNTMLPVAADVLSRVTQRLVTRGGIRHIYLRLPSGLESAVIRDLARLNWFTAVALDSASTETERARVEKLLRYYKPGLTLGAYDRPVEKADFVLTPISPDQPARALRSQARAVLAAHRHAMILLRRGAQTSDETLRAAMRALQSAGVTHYGYGPDDFENDVPSVLHVVKTLHEYTAAGDR